MSVLDLTATWPATHVAGAVVWPNRSVDTTGDPDRRFRIASISKMLVGWTVLVAVEEGTLHLDEPLDRIGAVHVDGITVRHLLSHAAGFAFDTLDRLAAPGTRRIYSNTGIDLCAELLQTRAAMPFADYLNEALLMPLGMTNTTLNGSPAKDMHSSVADLVRFIAELEAPTLISEASAVDFQTVQFAGLAGTVPGVARYDDCPWGLGTELRGSKQPHWTGTRNSSGTYGHFGGAGTLLWVDPAAAAACVVLTDRPFDEWSREALRLWPQLSDAIVDAAHASEAAR